MLGEKILKNGLWLFGRKIAVIGSVFFDQVTCWWITGSFNPVGRHTVKAELLQQLLQGKWMVRSHGCGTFRKRAVGDLAGSVPQILVGKLYLMQVSSTPQDKGLLASARISSAELQGIFLSIGTKTVIVPQPHTIKKWTDDFLFCILSPQKWEVERLQGKQVAYSFCIWLLAWYELYTKSWKCPMGRTYQNLLQVLCGTFGDITFELSGNFKDNWINKQRMLQKLKAVWWWNVYILEALH